MQRKTAKEMRRIIAGFSDYAGTKKSYCAKRKITIHVYDYWAKKLNVFPIQPKTEQFIALEVAAEKRQRIEKIELHYPNGNQLLFSPDTSLELLENLIKINCSCLV